MTNGGTISFLTLVFIFIIIRIGDISASAGDRSQLFINCLRGCRHNNCTEGNLTSPSIQWINSTLTTNSVAPFADGLEFKEGIEQEWINGILLWSCHDECVYRCMWRTTNAFVSRQWEVPQFYGKWPFKRFMGIQEPASVLFSLLNLIVHWKMMRKFRDEVRSDSPMYYVWHVFCAVRAPGTVMPSPDSCQFHSNYSFSDLYQRLDVFGHFSHSRFPTHRAPRLWFCLFNGSGQFLLHAFTVTSRTFRMSSDDPKIIQNQFRSLF